MSKLTDIVRYSGAAALRCAAVLLVASLFGSTAQAVPIEFANVNLVDANQPLRFTNNGGISGTLSALNVSVTFNFTSQSGLSTADHAGTLTLNALSTPTLTPASAAGGLLNQPISSPITLSITENGTGKNLLTMSFTGDVVGTLGGPNASLSGAQVTGQTVVFTSDFGSFGMSNKSFIMGLATLSPPLSIGPGGFSNNFIANVNGQFSAEFTPIPEPATVALFAVGLAGVAAAARRKARRMRP